MRRRSKRDEVQATAATIALSIHGDLLDALTVAAGRSGTDLTAFCRRMLRMGFADYVPDERLPELPDTAGLELQRGDYPSLEAMSLYEAEKAARRVMVQLLRGSIIQARVALEDAWTEHVGHVAPLPTGKALLNVPLARVIDDLRLLNALDRENIVTVRDFLDSGSAVWYGITNVGSRTVSTLQALAERLRAGVAKEAA